ncbi:MAG: redoxin domain-containing protein [Candidatus Thermoplasmatota archaeon]
MNTKKSCVPVGVHAADFTLDDQNGQPFHFAEHHGKKILLSFHPLAWTPVCAQQMQSLEQNTRIFHELNTLAVGISVDPVPSKKAWAQHLNIIHTRLLSDFWPHGSVAKKYGIFRSDEGISERANIIVGENQLVEYIQLYDLGTLPDVQEIITVLKTGEVPEHD